MVVVVRTDIEMGKGKLAAQVAHAAVECVLETLKKYPEKIERWRKEGAKKIVLKVKDEKELLEIYDKALKEGLISVLIKDAGLTQIPPGTITCVGIGPDEDEKIDRITGHLKLL